MKRNIVTHEQAEGMDDMAEAASAINARFECHGPCSQGHVDCPTPEACQVPRKERMGQFHAWERIWLERPGWVALGALVSFAFLVWALKP